MPDPFTHYIFGQKVLEQLPPPIRQTIRADVFDRALQGPDPFSCLGFYGGKRRSMRNRSGIMHKQRTGTFLLEIAREAQNEPSPALFSFLAGFLCHYALDRTAHPYIIGKGGESFGDAATLPYRSGHVRLERAIDCRYLRAYFKKEPWKTFFPRLIFKAKQYPEELRGPLDRIFREVYGWEQSFDTFNAALRDEAVFYRVMQDPWGIIRFLLRPLRTKKTLYAVYSYYKREIDSAQVDYVNESHAPWHHPFAPEQRFEASFSELFEQSLGDATAMIDAAFRYVFLKEPVGLEDVFQDKNYSTGLDCHDPCNQALPCCEPFSFHYKG